MQFKRPLVLPGTALLQYDKPKESSSLTNFKMVKPGSLTPILIGHMHTGESLQEWVKSRRDKVRGVAHPKDGRNTICRIQCSTCSYKEGILIVSFSISLYVFLSFSLNACLSIYLSIYLSFCLSIYLSISSLSNDMSIKGDFVYLFQKKNVDIILKTFIFMLFFATLLS